MAAGMKNISRHIVDKRGGVRTAVSEFGG